MANDIKGYNKSFVQIDQKDIGVSLGTKLYAIGYGSPAYKQSPTWKLNEVKVPVADTLKCIKQLEDVFIVNPETAFCAGYPEGKKGKQKNSIFRYMLS